MAKDYIHVPGPLFKTLWAKHNSALTFHMALTSLVTVEIPDPEFPGQKLGIVLGGTELRDSDLAQRLEQSLDTIKHGRTELQKLGLLVKRQYQHTYKLALRQSDKWSSKNQGQMWPKYRWVNEALVSVKPLPESHQESVKWIPRAVNSLAAGNLPIPDGNLPLPLDSETKIPKNLREGKPSLKPSLNQREKAKPDEKPKPAPSRSFSGSKPKPSDKEIPQEAINLVADLFMYADDYAALFDRKQQFAVATLLEKYTAADIKELWQEVWDSKDNDRKRFAVKDFLRIADGRLESKLVWRESLETARRSSIQGESSDGLFARLEAQGA